MQLSNHSDILVISVHDKSQVSLLESVIMSKKMFRCSFYQNHAVRVIMKIKVSDRLHISPLLHELHWLPVEFKILYKINLQSFKCLQQQGPAYFTDYILRYEPVRSLRSEAQGLLKVNGKVQPWSTIKAWTPHLLHICPQTMK